MTLYDLHIIGTNLKQTLLLEHEGRIKTDTLQKLHSVSNLAELLEAGHKVNQFYSGLAETFFFFLFLPDPTGSCFFNFFFLWVCFGFFFVFF